MTRRAIPRSRLLVALIAVVAQLPLAFLISQSNGLSSLLGHVPVCHDAPWNLAAIGTLELADCGAHASLPSPITAEELIGKTRTEIRELAIQKGLEAYGDTSLPEYPRKWRDPADHAERLRLDTGHVDPHTGEAYNDPKAAVDHVHGYEPDGVTKIRHPSDNNPHFPTTGP